MLRLVAFRFYGKQPASLAISFDLPLVSLALPWILIWSVVVDGVVAISMQAQLQLEAKLNLCASRNFLQIVHCCSALLIGWVVTHCQLPYLRLPNLPLPTSPPLSVTHMSWAHTESWTKASLGKSFNIILHNNFSWHKNFRPTMEDHPRAIVDTWLTARMGIRTGGRAWKLIKLIKKCAKVA